MAELILAVSLQNFTVDMTLHSWVERGTMRVKCLAGKQNSDPRKRLNADLSIWSFNKH